MRRKSLGIPDIKPNLKVGILFKTGNPTKNRESYSSRNLNLHIKPNLKVGILFKTGNPTKNRESYINGMHKEKMGDKRVSWILKNPSDVTRQFIKDLDN